MKKEIHNIITRQRTTITRTAMFEKENGKDLANSVGGEQKRKRGWPKGKPRGPKKPKYGTTEVVMLYDSPIKLTTPIKEEKLLQSKVEKSEVSSAETIRTLRNFIVKRMHALYKFKLKLEQPEQINKDIAREALEAMEAYLLKNLNRIREFKSFQNFDETFKDSAQPTKLPLSTTPHGR